MKIKEITFEGLYDRDNDDDDGIDDTVGYDDFELDKEFGDEPEIDELESDAGNPIIRSVIKNVRDLIGQGHTDVEPMVLTNMVVKDTGKPFLLKDLVAINNKSREVQHYIDSINPSKIKFSSDILTVKNEDPNKKKEDAGKTVGSMATRARNSRT